MKKLGWCVLFCILFGGNIAQARTWTPKQWKVFLGPYTGCFLLMDLKTKKIILQNDPKLCSKRATPCSTFKIVNALIGLQTHSVQGPKQLFKWDKVRRFYPPWNQDLTLHNAFRFSAVWVFQRLARRIGAKRMQNRLNRIPYGNKDISGGLSRFWLGSSLRISPKEQLSLLYRLYTHTLPFRKNVQMTVQGMMLLKKTKRFTLSGKTGSEYRKKRWVRGWFVGHLATKKKRYLFATHIYKKTNASGRVAQKITVRILRHLGLM